MSNDLLIANIPTPSPADNTQAQPLGGKAGEALTAALHNINYTAAYRGRTFIGGALIAGVIIPVNTATAATFTLYNPIGSGVNLELICLDLGWPAAATTVVGTILGSLSVQTPTAVTAGGYTLAMPLNGTNAGVAQAKLYTAATITAITTHLPLIQVTSTADAEVSSHYDFNGRVLLGPGSLITLTSTPVQTGVALPVISWSEFPT